MRKTVSLMLMLTLLFTAVSVPLLSVKVAAADPPTYNQYLADYNLTYGGYDLYRNDFTTPYRSFVDTKRDSRVYQSLLGAWRVATFELSDFSSYSQKEVGFYESFIFDVLYEGYQMENMSGKLQSTLKATNASAVKKLAEFTGEEIGALTRLKPENLSVGAADYLTRSCTEIQEAMKPIGTITKVFSYAEDVEDLIYKLTKLSIIMENSNESVKILTAMKNSTSNQAFKEALDKIITSISGKFTESEVMFLLGADYAIDKTFEYVLDAVWDDVISNFNLYGLAFQAGQTGGKLLTHALFSTDEDVELYYRMCALYEFEDQVKRALTSYESSYKSSKSNAAAATFNSAYKMLLKTHLLGIKASQDYADIQYKKGAINQLLKMFKQSEYDTYTDLLKSMQTGIETTIDFADSWVYNLYLEEYFGIEMDVLALLGVSPEPLPHTELENNNIIALLEVKSFLASDVDISTNLRGFALNENINLTLGTNTLSINGTIDLTGRVINGGDGITMQNLTFTSGTLILSGTTLNIVDDLNLTGGTMNINRGKIDVGGNLNQGGTMDINGGILNISGNITQTGGIMNINGGRLNVGGDYSIAGVTRNGLGEKVYSYSNGFLQMALNSD